MLENSLTVGNVQSVAEMTGLGKVFVESGYFSDTKAAAQAVVKMMAGRELNFGPIASMTGVYIVNGRVALSANLMAARIKSSGRYNYRVRSLDAAKCEIEFFERSGTAWESVGLSSFTMDDARKAGTKNLDKFPRNMLFARAMSNGAKWYCADLFSGAPIYTPDELGAAVDENGEVIPVAVPSEVEIGPKNGGNGHAGPSPEPAMPRDVTAWADSLKPSEAPRDSDIQGVHTRLAGLRAKHSNDAPCTPDILEKMRGLMVAKLDHYLGGEEPRHVLIESLFGVLGGSSKKLKQAELAAVLDWMCLSKMDDNGQKVYVTTPDTDVMVKEANAVIAQYREQHGQSKLM